MKKKNENEYDRLERLALEFVEKLRGGKRRDEFVGLSITCSKSEHQDTSRETVWVSIMTEFDDKAGYLEDHGPKVSQWIEDHIDLIGEVSFCEQKRRDEN